jgi:Transmembrane exosortase (Exosortase_EpsH)
VLVAERGREWCALPEALIVVILALLLYRGIVRGLALQWWDDPNYSHGFLVPFFSGYLIWHQRHESQAQAPRGVLGLAVLVAGILELLLGDLGAENFPMRVELRRTLAACPAAQFNRLTPAAGDVPYYEQQPRK